ncbi:autotransporter domain-containing protein [Sporomusa sphaeroides]|uniref:autotransporter domain-containing protein n=1 Tax=Sporomusa sphaeroides TaxID=47679 RepID=UPI00202F2640|nr:autotransporter outer membrane beta-barrel domain-containing protein [Sporomusa sphaeroides]MCM0759218.1 autotransporter outer membrane beta-barrel domain-containing protein [Sporomusa sphaeroides DSM 2875]HML35300.1 autotransporter outer membrane beta-barrel domain-containing protein [Sporomusa sphaeroides]
MLRLSENAIKMLVSKYRAVLQRMLVKNTAVFAACCVMFGAVAPVGAADVTYDDAKATGGTGLQTAAIGGASNPSLFPGTSAVPSASGSTITVDYTTGTQPYRVFGGLSDSAAVTGNTVNFLNGTVTNNLYGGYDAAAANGLGAAGNTVTISGGTIDNMAISGISLNGNATNNKITISGGTVKNQVRGGSANAAGDAIGNSVVISGGMVGDGLGIDGGWVIGGYSESGTSSGNTVTISGTAKINRVDAGESTSGPVTGNKLFVTGGAIMGGTARAAWSDTGLVSGNEAHMSGGIIHDFDDASGSLMGGYSNSGNAENNLVTMSGGSVSDVTGGSSGDGNAIGNKAIMSGGEANTLEGGFSSEGSTENNEVLFSDGKVGHIYGGKTMDNSVVLGHVPGNASGNTVNITGGEILYAVYGGMSSQGSANDNTVTIGSNVRLAATSSVYGGWIDPSSSGTSTGNTLNVNGFTGTLKEVNSFQNYNFFLPASLQNGGTMLTVTDATNLADTHVTITGMEGGSPLKQGDTVTLINNTTGTPAAYHVSNVQSGISMLYDFDMAATAGKGLTATLTSAQVNPQTKALAEGVAAGMAFINQGADMAVGDGLADARAQAQAAGGAIAMFGGMSHGSSKYKTGSHADVQGTSLIIGWAKQQDAENGAVLKGLFLETGWGNYDSYNSFGNMPSVKGQGDTRYYGLGVLARQDKANGSYLEGSLRGGKSKTDFSSSDLRTPAGQRASYDSDAAYYGAHIGVGKLKVNGNKTLDTYVKYLWTHQNGDNVTIAGERFNFDGTDSHRLRIGARLSKAQAGGKVTNYAGLAYEYEFDGKAQGSVYGMSLDAPSLNGGTGILELGVSIKSRPESSNSLELGLQGYAGKREGVTGTVQLKRVF